MKEIEKFIEESTDRKLLNKLANFNPDEIQKHISEEIKDLCEHNYKQGYDNGFVKGIEIASQYIDLLYSAKESSEASKILKEFKDYLNILNYDN